MHCLRHKHTETNLGFLPLLVPCAATVVYSIPSAGVHRRTGEQVSGTTRLCDPVRERANKVFGKRSARLLAFFITGRLPSKSGGAAYRRLRRQLLRPVFANFVVNNVTAATATANSSTTDQYVRRDPIYTFNMVIVAYALLILMLINASTMFYCHMLVAFCWKYAQEQ